MQARYQATLQPEQKKGQLAATSETRQERFSPEEKSFHFYRADGQLSVEIFPKPLPNQGR
jgi:hypothetical protein